MQTQERFVPVKRTECDFDRITLVQEPDELKSLEPIVLTAIGQAYTLAFGQKPGSIGIIKDYVAKYPNIAQVHYALVIAYDLNEKKDLFYSSAKSLFERFPQYVFGRCAYTQALIDHGQFAQAAELFGDYRITELYSGRTTFQVDEFFHFQQQVGRYLLALSGDPHYADGLVEDLKKYFGDQAKDAIEGIQKVSMMLQARAWYMQELMKQYAAQEQVKPENVIPEQEQQSAV